jgi:natural resistance-associated macrophage protein
LVPRVPSYGLNIAVGTVGAVIMPHNIYLHSALVQSRKVDHTDPVAVRSANKYFGIESALALFFSFWINLFVVGSYASSFFEPGCAEAKGGPYARLPLGGSGFNSTDVCEAYVIGEHGSGHEVCCGSIGLVQTQYALAGTLGASAKYIWAVGLLAAGQASTMTGVFAGQFVMEGFLQLQIAPWKRLMLTRSVALIPALATALGTQADPKVSDDVDQWLNILQSVQLPFALLPVLHFTSDAKLMRGFENGVVAKVLCWLLALFVIGINVWTVWSYVSNPSSPTPYDTRFFVAVGVAGVAYFAFILAVVQDDLRQFARWVCTCCGGGGEAASGGLTVNATPAETRPLLGGEVGSSTVDGLQWTINK